MAGARFARHDSIRLDGARILIVEARYYEDIADALLHGAKAAIEAAGASAEVVTVPGALEIPAAILIALEGAAKAGRPFDAVVALGTVIRGATSHYEIVAGESSRALMDLSVNRMIALGNGILTVENESQAWMRAKPSEMNKGGAAAEAAIAMAHLKRLNGLAP